VAEQVNILDPNDGTTVIGNVQLKYSPSCRATWARVIQNVGFVGSRRAELRARISLLIQRPPARRSENSHGARDGDIENSLDVSGSINPETSSLSS